MGWFGDVVDSFQAVVKKVVAPEETPSGGGGSSVFGALRNIAGFGAQSAALQPAKLPPPSEEQGATGATETCQESPQMADSPSPWAAGGSPNSAPGGFWRLLPGMDAQAEALKPDAPQAEPTGNKPDVPTATDAELQKVDALRRSMSGCGTNEQGLFDALKGSTPEEVSRLRAIYRDQYGKDLDADIGGELSGKDLAEAQALLKGDEVGVATAALNNSVGVWNDDEAKIEETLRGLGPDGIAKLQADPAGREALEKARKNLGGEDREVLDALVAGDDAKASAVRLDEALSGLGTDEKAIEKYLSGKSPEERDAIRTAFAERRGDGWRWNPFAPETNLEEALRGDLSGDEQRRLVGLAQDGDAGLAAAELHNAAAGLGTDERGIYDALDGKSDAERQQIVEVYERDHGRGSLDKMLQGELSGLDLQRAQELAASGQLSDVTALRAAVDGAGTDEDAIKDVLDGKTKDEIAQICTDYEKETGENLTTRLLGGELEHSGRDRFDVEQALKGVPETPEEMLARANERYAYSGREEQGWWGGLSRRFMDAGETLGLTDTGSQLDRNTERVREMFDDQGQLKPGMEAELERVSRYQKKDANRYGDAKDEAGEIAGTVAGVVAAAAATPFTGGGSWAIVVPALVGGGTDMLVQSALRGQSYGGGEMLQDGLTTLGTAGANKFTKGAKLTRLFRGTGTLARGANRVVPAAIGGAVEHSGEAAFDDEAWRQGGGVYFGNLAKAGGLGALQGTVETGVGAGLGKRFPTNLDSRGRRFVNGALSQGGGEVAGSLVQPTTYDGDAQDIGLRLLGTFAKGAAKGGMKGAFAHPKEARALANRLEEYQKKGDRSLLPPETRHLFDSQSVAEQRLVIVWLRVSVAEQASDVQSGERPAR